MRLESNGKRRRAFRTPIGEFGLARKQAVCLHQVKQSESPIGGMQRRILGTDVMSLGATVRP